MVWDYWDSPAASAAYQEHLQYASVSASMTALARSSRLDWTELEQWSWNLGRAAFSETSCCPHSGKGVPTTHRWWVHHPNRPYSETQHKLNPHHPTPQMKHWKRCKLQHALHLASSSSKWHCSHVGGHLSRRNEAGMCTQKHQLAVAHHQAICQLLDLLGSTSLHVHSSRAKQASQCQGRKWWLSWQVDKAACGSCHHLCPFHDRNSAQCPGMFAPIESLQ